MIMSNMEIILLMLMIVSSYDRVIADCCFKVKSIEGTCNKEVHTAGHIVPQNSTDYRIKLPGSQKSINWFCGSKKETIDSFFTPINQLRVDYHSDATVHLTLFACSEITGPFEAGSQCAVQEISWTCPSTADAGCVYELQTDKTSSQSKTTVNSLTAEAAAGVRLSAVDITGSTEAGVETTVSGSKVVSTSQGHYLEIPAGISFCAYTEAISVKDVHAPSGFAWKCSFTKFVETSFKLDSDPASCSDLYHCDDGVCDAYADNCPYTCKSSAMPVFSLLTWAAMVIVIAVASHF